MNKNIIIFTLCAAFLSFIPLAKANNLQLAQSLFCNSNYIKAISQYSNVLENEKLSSREKSKIYYQIGLCYFMLGEFETALEYFIPAKRLNPGIFDGKIFRIPSSTMDPTLIVGDHIIADLECYKISKISRGDIVVFIYPEQMDRIFIKRVIGLPNETLEIVNKEIFINSIKLFDKFGTFTDDKILPIRDNLSKIKIPEGYYFLIGDNRDQSYDSRYFGFVKNELIIGKALVIYGNFPLGYSLENSNPERQGIIIK